MNKIKKILKENIVTRDLYKTLSKIYNYKYKVMSDENYAKVKYKKETGIDLDIKNPKTFDEKLWWIKYNYHNPLMTMCADKFWVRDYIRLCGYKDILNKVYGVYKNAKEIDFDNLPDNPVFFKTTHGSGVNAIYDKNKPFNREKFIKKFNKALKQNYYDIHREWQYKNIEPQITCEKMLPCNLDELVDYKFMCCNGKAINMYANLYTCAENGEHSDDLAQNIYDLDFNHLEDLYFLNAKSFDSKLVEKPKNLNEMIEIAEKLSSPFPHARIDLYNIKGKIFFGEITFDKDAGYNYNTCNKNEYLQEFADKIELKKEL